MTYHEINPNFTYDRMRDQIKADTAGYSFLCSKYNRPSRADAFLSKRLNQHFNSSFGGRNYAEGQTVVFTVKAQRYRVYALCLPRRPIEPQDNFDISVLIGDKTKEYRFFDTAEEAFHHRALRELTPPEQELLDIGHLQHKEWKPSWT